MKVVADRYYLPPVVGYHFKKTDKGDPLELLALVYISIEERAHVTKKYANAISRKQDQTNYNQIYSQMAAHLLARLFGT